MRILTIKGVIPMAKSRKKRTNPNYSIYTDHVSRNLDKVKELIESGASHKDLANYFGVGNDVISLWKKAHPEFRAAIIEAKESRRIEQVSKVESALYKRALGYDAEQTDTTVTTDANGNIITTTEKTSKKHIPADQKSIEFFLKNRDPENWAKSSSDVNIDMGGVLMVPDGNNNNWEQQVKEQQKKLAQSAKEASEDAIG